MIYFWQLHNDLKNLPKDLRNLDVSEIKNKYLNSIELKKLINKIFKREISDKKIKKNIYNIIDALKKNEICDKFYLINISRFSIVFKNNTKVLKIGFPKVTYKIPSCSIILNSIIRKQYQNIIFVEIQDYKKNNLESMYSKEEIDNIIYSIWKEFRKNNIIWFDPKSKNIVIDDNNTNVVKWNENYYSIPSNEEKGVYNTDFDIVYQNFKIVDTDLFLPISVIDDLKKSKEENPDAPGFTNWKYRTLLDYENRYNKEVNNEKL